MTTLRGALLLALGMAALVLAGMCVGVMIANTAQETARIARMESRPAP